MAYFNFTNVDCACYKPEWDAVIEQVQGWSPERKGYLRGLIHHLEAKALHVFTMASRLVYSAYVLADFEGRNWKLVFVEPLTLLFPMIELVGEARLGRNQGHKLGAGIEWLLDPSSYPSVYPPGTPPTDVLKRDTRRLTSLESFMVDHSDGPEVSNLFHLRNYYLHGLKNLGEKGVLLKDIVNYELPYAIASQAEIGLRVYWEQLCSDDGNQGWVDRLAHAKIQPLPIPGSGGLDEGLIDYWIVDYLESDMNIFDYRQK